MNIFLDSIFTFSITVFKKLILDAADVETAIVSPVSIYTLLSIAANGSSEGKKEQITKTLCYSDTIPKLNNEMKILFDSFNPSGDKEYGISNIFFHRKDEKINDTFKKNCKFYYKAQVIPFDSTDKKEALDFINKTVSQSSNQFLNNALEKVSDDFSIFLISTFFFKGAWKNSFDASKTKEDYFVLGNEVLEVELMCQKNVFKYVEYFAYKAISMDFNNSDYSLIVILPNNNYSLNRAHFTMINDGGIDTVIGGMKNFNVELEIPKFKIESKLNLNEVIKDVENEEAKFDQFFVNSKTHTPRIVQKFKIEINENGLQDPERNTTEPEPLNSTLENKTLKLNNPFLFYLVKKVKDNKRNIMRNLPIMVGTYKGPKQ